MNVSNIIERQVAENPEKAAIIFGNRSISYAELDRLINRTAGGLLKMGYAQGDVVSLFLPSLPELIIGYLGTVRAGLTVNVVNAMLKEQLVKLNVAGSRHPSIFRSKVIFRPHGMLQPEPAPGAVDRKDTDL